jgi:hypothetical protein
MERHTRPSERAAGMMRGSGNASPWHQSMQNGREGESQHVLRNILSGSAHEEADRAAPAEN